VRRRLVLAGLAAVVLAGGGWALWYGLARPGEPLRGELIVRVRTKDSSKRDARVGVDPLALPVREDEFLQLEAKLNQPAYIYLLWVDGKGEVFPLYPWNPNPEGKLVYRTLAAPPPPQVPQAVVFNPPRLKEWFRIDDTEGLDTMLLLARRTPLPADVSLARLVDKLPEARLGPLHEFVVRGMDRGQPVEEVKQDVERRPKGEVEEMEDQLLQLMDPLKDHFELIRAVQFAHAKK
jgi:hypothetical protein